MVAARVTHLLERDDVIPAEQVGFRRGHSAEENLGCLIPEVQDGWNRPPPRGRPSDGKTAARFVLTAYDFSRAYDVIDAETEDVPPSPTLPDHLDLPLPLRPPSVCQVNGVRSHSRSFRVGLPQGFRSRPDPVQLFTLWSAGPGGSAGRVPGASVYICVYVRRRHGVPVLGRHHRSIAQARGRAQQAGTSS